MVEKGNKLLEDSLNQGIEMASPRQVHVVNVGCNGYLSLLCHREFCREPSVYAYAVQALFLFFKRCGS